MASPCAFARSQTSPFLVMFYDAVASPFFMVDMCGSKIGWIFLSDHYYPSLKRRSLKWIGNTEHDSGEDASKVKCPCFKHGLLGMHWYQ